MSEPMSAERLEEILCAHEKHCDWCEWEAPCPVDALLAEVDRLRAQVATKPKTIMRYRVEVRGFGRWVWWGTYGSLETAIEKAEAHCASAYRVIDRETGKPVDLA